MKEFFKYRKRSCNSKKQGMAWCSG